MKSKSRTENLILICISIGAAGAVVGMNIAGMPHKWHTAIFATIVPFTTVILLRSASWSRQTFWLSLWLLLGIHSFLIYVVFGVMMRRVLTFGLLWWLPLAFLEVFVLLNLGLRIERWMRREKGNQRSREV
jgi:hypothetical protein